MKSGTLNLLEPSGSVQACKGIAFTSKISMWPLFFRVPHQNPVPIKLFSAVSHLLLLAVETQAKANASYLYSSLPHSGRLQPWIIVAFHANRVPLTQLFLAAVQLSLKHLALALGQAANCYDQLANRHAEEHASASCVSSHSLRFIHAYLRVVLEL